MAHATDPIDPTEILLRRITIQQVVYENGIPRPPSMAFRDGYTNELSVHRVRLTTPEALLALYPGVFLAAIVAEAALALGYTLRPEPEADDPSHAVVVRPEAMGTSAHRRGAKELARQATWFGPVQPPPQTPPSED
jgi:hypothetical protein